MESPNDPFGDVQVAFGNLVSNIKTDADSLLQLATTSKDERPLLEAARTMALQVSRLVDFVDERVSDVLEQLVVSKPADVSSQLEALSSACHAVRDSVLELLKHAKKSFENPLDYLNEQNLKSSSDAVESGLQKASSCFDQLQQRVLAALSSSRPPSQAPSPASSMSSLPKLSPSPAQAPPPPLQSPGRESRLKVASQAFGEQVALLVETLLGKFDEDTPALEGMRKVVLSLREVETSALTVGISCVQLKLHTQSLLEESRLLLTFLHDDDDAEKNAVLTKVRECVVLVTQEVKEIVSKATKVLSSNTLIHDQSVSTSRSHALRILDVFTRSSYGMHHEWQLLDADFKEKALAQVEHILKSYAPAQAPAPASAPAPSATTTPQPLKVVSIPSGASKTSKVSFETESKLSMSDVPTKTVVPPSLLRGRSLTVKPTLARPNNGPQREKEVQKKKQLEMFTGVSDLKHWEKLLSGEDGSLVHMGGLIGDVRILSQSSSSQSAINVEQISKSCLSYILASNAASISKSTTREAVETAAKTFLSDVRTAIAAVLERLNHSLFAEAEELLLTASQSVERLDLTAITPDEFMVKDASQQMFSELLKELHTFSDALRAVVLHFLTTLQAVERRCNSTKQTEKISAFSLSIVLQTASSGMGIVDTIKSLHTVVVTARQMSAVPPPAPSPRLDKSSSAPIDQSVDFWTEVLTLRGSSSTNLLAQGVPSPASTPTSPAATTKNSRFLNKLFHRGGGGGEESSAAQDGSAASPSAPGKKSTSNLLAKKSNTDLRALASSNTSNPLPNTATAAAPVPAGIISELPKRGTLNELIQAVTHSSLYDHRYMSAFITTYQSFTTGEIVLRKLMERYKVPESVHETDRLSIQLRVPVVLKYWVETQPDDFDDRMLSKLTNFAQGPLKNNQANLADMLLKEIEKLVLERKNRKAIFEAPPTDFSPVAGVESPADLIMQISSEEIARQLTIIDHSIYASIKASELLGQAWTKPKTRHLAPNVYTLISRLNRISYWIPTMVLLQDSDETRPQALVKFIEIAKHLRSMNNFHTLMGVIAGLNMAAVSRSRLKQTWSHVPQEMVDTFLELESLMSPTGSFKNYRAALRSSKLPAMPYMGSVCGDLIFLDEGNPNNIDGLINFEKRQDIYRMLQEVESFARMPFKFPKVEPINSLLTSLPSFSDKELYSLSLCIEARAKQ